MRLRIQFAKYGAAKYSGHLDLHKTWERILRRAGLPLAYSQGFHPQPRLHLAAALPLGMTSECELADAWLNSAVDLDKTSTALKAASAPGIDVLSVGEVDDSLPALQSQIKSADYSAALAGSVDGLDERVAGLIAASSILRKKRGKPYDLRPLIETLKVAGPGLRMRLAARDAATGRPEEVLEALELGGMTIPVHRTALWFIDSSPPDLV
jgi:radical SAM-linked protein